MSPVKIIIFDCDGVILDSVDIKTNAFVSLFEGYGQDAVELITDYHLRHGGVSRFEKFKYFFREYLGRSITEDEMLVLDQKFTKAALDALLKTPLIPGVKEFLAAHHETWPLYVASGAPEHELKFIFNHLDLTQYFQGIYGSPRPKHAILAHIVQECEVKPEDALMVGDSHTDLAAALTVGTRFLGVGEFEPPHPWMDDLTGLEKFLNNLA
ncbi:MAG: HAD family hydrolase [Thermodesulfobacteriota bacterium]|nr:HAD family hydrolase [Thermodesulfobacteriota bacterium]